MKNNIKSARERKGLTQEQLAKEINVTKKTISNYETGCREPSITVLKLISNILDVSIDYLVENYFYANKIDSFQIEKFLLELYEEKTKEELVEKIKEQIKLFLRK